MTAPSDQHHHHHHHDHDHAEGSLRDRNIAHWNENAHKYGSKEWQEAFGDLTNKVTAFINQRVSWFGVDFLEPSRAFEKPEHSKTQDDDQRQVRVLDYACGPGPITRALAGYASEYIGIDVAEKMVEEYNKLCSVASESGSEALNAHAVVGDLLDTAGPSPHLSGTQFFDFDLAIVGLGFHHFGNLQLATKRLAERLKPGGVLAIIDFLPHGHEDLGFNTEHIISHHGFGPPQVQQLFQGAGLTDIDFIQMPGEVIMKGTAKRSVFMARGKKAV